MENLDGFLNNKELFNMYAYYIHKERYDLDEFLPVMDKMFQKMTPGNMGYPFLYKFGRLFLLILLCYKQIKASLPNMIGTLFLNHFTDTLIS